MSTSDKLPQHIQALYEDGRRLKERILEVLEKWPVDSKGKGDDFEKTASEHKAVIREVIVDIRRWFNTLNIEVLPLVVYDKQYLYYTLRQVEASAKKMTYIRPYPTSGPQTVEVVQRDRPFVFPASRRSNKADIEDDASLEVAKAEAGEGMDI